MAPGAVPGPLAELIRTEGPLRFDRFVDFALYDPTYGFFATGGGAGRRGADFITSVELGHLFAAVLARWLDDVWHDLGRPDPFRVVEGGAGRGALAAGLVAAHPRCADALELVLVERSEVLRRAHGEIASRAPQRPEAGMAAAPRVTSVAELSAVGEAHVVVANELLDNLAVRLMDHHDDGWSEVHVDLGPDGALVEVSVPCEAPDVVAPVGSRVPLQTAAADWVQQAIERVGRGRVLVVDYADTTESMAARPMREWLRTYRGHERGRGVLEHPGSQDITVDVAVDQLPPGARQRTQADWLVAHGIEDLVATARATWHERAAVGDLDALRARSRVGEADALLDPAGLGGFAVLEWRVG